MEIYKEKVCDLLVSSTSAKETNRQHLRVREHPENGPYVESEYSTVVYSTVLVQLYSGVVLFVKAVSDGCCFCMYSSGIAVVLCYIDLLI